MKKLVGIILSVILVTTGSISAFAANINSVPGSTNAEVKAKYNSVEKTDVYSVDVTWGAMEFDYNEGGETWNTETHKWESDMSTSSGWKVKNSSNTITLANNSSKNVGIAFEFTPNKEYTNLSGQFIYNGAELKNDLSLELPKVDTPAKQYVVSFNPKGSIPSTHSKTAYEAMGSITVTLK